MRLTAHLLTCAGREGVLAETLADFARTDWPGAPLVYRAPPEPGDPVGSTERGHLRLLRDGLAGPGNHFLLLEDDIRCNRHLHHNLLAWSLRADLVGGKVVGATCPYGWWATGAGCPRHAGRALTSAGGGLASACRRG